MHLKAWDSFTQFMYHNDSHCVRFITATSLVFNSFSQTGVPPACSITETEGKGLSSQRVELCDLFHFLLELLMDWQGEGSVY